MLCKVVELKIEHARPALVPSAKTRFAGSGCSDSEAGKVPRTPQVDGSYPIRLEGHSAVVHWKKGEMECSGGAERDRTVDLLSAIKEYSVDRLELSARGE